MPTNIGQLSLDASSLSMPAPIDGARGKFGPSVVGLKLGAAVVGVAVGLSVVGLRVGSTVVGL